MEPTTDQMMREFLEGQRRERDEKGQREWSITRKIEEGQAATLMALKAFSQQIRGDFESLRDELRQDLNRVEKRAEEAHAIAMGASARLTAIEEKRKRAVRAATQQPALPPPWDLGDPSATGENVVIPRQLLEDSKREWSELLTEKLEQHELAKEGETWRWIKENGTKITVGVLGALLATVLITNFLTNRAQPPALPQTTGLPRP